METVNNIMLLLITVLAIVNLIIEIEDAKTYKYELILRMCYGALAVGSLSLIFYKQNYLFSIMYLSILVGLANRILHKKKK